MVRPLEPKQSSPRERRIARDGLLGQTGRRQLVLDHVERVIYNRYVLQAMKLLAAEGLLVPADDQPRADAVHDHNPRMKHAVAYCRTANAVASAPPWRA